MASSRQGAPPLILALAPANSLFFAADRGLQTFVTSPRVKLVHSTARQPSLHLIGYQVLEP